MFTSILSTLIIIFGATIIMIPIIWMLSTSVKQEDNTQTLPPEWLPRESAKVNIDGKNYFLYDVQIKDETKRLIAIRLNPEKSEFRDPNDLDQVYYASSREAKKVREIKFHWENYRIVWQELLTPFSQFMINTTIYSVVAVVGEVLSCALIGYGFARLRAPGKNILFFMILATMMLPWAVTMVPNYVLFTRHIPGILNTLLGTSIKLSDTWLPLMIPKFFGSPYLIFLIRQFILTIPREYDEAAIIEGASYFKVWAHVI
ncbi:MAG: carbohydrate ABC transporter permease, partial [Anaerolineaceae bacterium]|nr:carbohydrate ABC transporter permease [Anaerolineaceae bacterium]